MKKWWWVLLLGGGGSVFLVFMGMIVLLGMFDFFTGGKSLQPSSAQPSFNSPLVAQALTTEYLAWLHLESDVVDETVTTPELEASIAAVVSGGRVFSQAYICTNGKVESESCSLVNPHWHTSHEDAGLGHINSGGRPPDNITGWTKFFGPGGTDLFNVTNQTDAVESLYSQDLLSTQSIAAPAACPVPAGTVYVKPALEEYARYLQDPKVSPSGFAAQVLAMDNSYTNTDSLGAWAEATWEPTSQKGNNAAKRFGPTPATSNTDEYVDTPAEGPLWIVIDAYGPGKDFTQEWKPPTAIPTKKGVTCQYHTIKETTLTLATSVWVQSGSGPIHKAEYTGVTTAKDVNDPIYPGSSAFIVKARIHKDTRVYADFPDNGNTASVPLIPNLNAYIPVGVGHLIPPSPLSLCQITGRWKSDIDAASKATGVPAIVIEAEMIQESNGHQNVESPTGAIGLMELLPGTAAQMGVDPYIASQNILGGARYLAYIYAMVGSWHATFASYYAGPGAIQKDGAGPGMPWSVASTLPLMNEPVGSKNPQSPVQYADSVYGNVQALESNTSCSAK